MIIKLARKKIGGMYEKHPFKGASENNNSNTQIKCRLQNSSMMELQISNTLLFAKVKQVFVESFVRAMSIKLVTVKTENL